jgi:hypothetical protein
MQVVVIASEGREGKIVSNCGGASRRMEAIVAVALIVVEAMLVSCLDRKGWAV